MWEHYHRGKVDINDLTATLGDASTIYYQLFSPIPCTELTMAQWAGVRCAGLMNLSIQLSNHPAPLVLKTHNANVDIDELPLFPPGYCGKSVYIIRDPRDVAPSWARHLNQGIDEVIEGMAQRRKGFAGDLERKNMPGFLSSWDTHVNSWEQYKNILIVRYEDLKADPVKWFGDIVEHMADERNEAKITAAVKATRLNELKKQEAATGFPEAAREDHTFFGQGKGWRKELTKAQARKIEDTFSETMKKYHYI